MARQEWKWRQPRGLFIAKTLKEPGSAQNGTKQSQPLKVVSRCCGGGKDGPWTKEVIMSHLRQIDDSTAKRGRVESTVWKISPIKIEIESAVASKPGACLRVFSGPSI